MRKIEQWLSVHMDDPKITTKELHNIGRELDQNAVSVKVGNVYPITYGLMANVSLASS